MSSSVTGDGLKFAARNLTDKAPANQRIRRGAVIRLVQGRQGAGGRSPAAPGRGGVRRAPAQRRRHPGAGRRLRLRTQQVQPRDAGVPAAGLGVQAVHLFGGAGKGLLAGHGDQRRAVLRARRQAGGEAWEPKNYDGKFDGPMRLRNALAKSKNLVAVRVLQAIGPQYAQDYITRFGFDPKLHPAYPHDGPGRGLGDAAADGGRLRGLRQRRLPRSALPDRQGDGRPRQRAVGGQAGRRRREAPSAPSTRATRSS